MDACEVAAITDRALEGLESQTVEPHFEAWRRRVQQGFATKKKGEPLRR
jgi:hypothetical protein